MGNVTLHQFFVDELRRAKLLSEEDEHLRRLHRHHQRRVPAA